MSKISVSVVDPIPLAPTAFGGVPLIITRPANVTAYTAADVVGNMASGTGAILAFPNMGPRGSRIMLTSSAFELDIASVPASMTSFKLYLYSAPPASAIADNGAWAQGTADMAQAANLGFISLGTPALDTNGGFLYVETNIVNKQIKLVSDTLYGYLVTAGGYTPAANSEVYKITLHSVLL